MVTWGNTTVLGTPNAPANTTPSNTTATANNAFSFSSSISQPAPTNVPGSASLFGQSGQQQQISSGLFGSTTAQPGGGGLFGSTSTSSFGGGLFGNTISTPTSGGLFGTQAASTGSSTMGFGAPSSVPSGLFGSNVSSFGQQKQQQQQHVLGTRDVYEVLIANNARREELRIMNKMSTIYDSYNGTKAISDTDPNSKSAPFTAILYNPATGQQRQLLAMQQIPGNMYHNGGEISVVPIMNVSERPSQISLNDWNQALVRNPDPNYVPIGVVGADALKARVLWHQQQVDSIGMSIDSVNRTLDTIRSRSVAASHGLEACHQHHVNQRKRLLKLLQKLESIRCWNKPLQNGEIDALQKLTIMKEEVEKLRISLDGGNIQSRITKLQHEQYQNYGRSIGESALITADVLHASSSRTVLNERQLHALLTEHRNKLANITNQIKQDSKDLGLIHDHLLETSTVSVPNSMRRV